MDNARRDIAKLSASMRALNARLAKGYPEFSPDQSRGPDGRWGGGSSTNAARRTGKPPSSAKPGGPKKPRGPSKAARAAAERLGHGADRIRDAVQAVKAAEAERNRRVGVVGSAEDAKRAAEEAIKRIKGIEDILSGTSKGVWLEPTFADKAWNVATDLGNILAAMGALSIGSSIGSFIGGPGGGAIGSSVGLLATAGLAGTAITSGIYRVIRHIYRKLTIAGYQGVKPGFLGM